MAIDKATGKKAKIESLTTIEISSIPTISMPAVECKIGHTLHLEKFVLNCQQIRLQPFLQEIENQIKYPSPRTGRL